MKKHFSFEQVFEYIWQHCNSEGLWNGGDGTLAEEFDVSEHDGHTMLGDLCQRGLIEMLIPGTFAIVKWRERDWPEEEELCWSDMAVLPKQKRGNNC
jgi:hypothetical protein